MKVLIIDDSPESAIVARARLKKEDVEVICATDGKSGLEAARQMNPDLILLDISMPDMTGFEVCAALKDDRDLCIIPVIFLTGSDDMKDKVKGLDMGAVDYITKPFDDYELRARVRAALRTKRLQDLLLRYAQIDPLTELANRRAMLDRLQQEWARIHRSGGSLACIMADIDHFKEVNDKHGHCIGDEILKTAAQILLHQCRESDQACRYGGDEFFILLPDGSAESAAALAERCRKETEESLSSLANVTGHVTCSFGVSDSTDKQYYDDMIRAADAALYSAKVAGRNRVEIRVQPVGAPAESASPAGNR